MKCEDIFVCPSCGGRYFGSSLHDRTDGTYVVLARQCHDEFGVGCTYDVRLESSSHNEIREGDWERTT